MHCYQILDGISVVGIIYADSAVEALRIFKRGSWFIGYCGVKQVS